MGCCEIYFATTHFFADKTSKMTEQTEINNSPFLFVTIALVKRKGRI